MTTLTVTVPHNKKEYLARVLKDIGGEVIEVVSQEDPLDKLREGLCEVRAIREGKMKGLSLADILGTDANN